jgi:hypothetical protein
VAKAIASPKSESRNISFHFISVGVEVYVTNIRKQVGLVGQVGQVKR